MKPVRFVFVVLTLLILAALAACTPTADTNACEFDPAVVPSAVGPDGMLVDSLRPTFTWTFPEDCEPDGYRVEIIVPLISDDEPATGTPHDPVYDYDVIVGETSGAGTSWTPASDLEPATAYRWRVAVRDGADNWGYFSNAPLFWTGPLCDAAQVWSPELVSPAHAAVVTVPSLDLLWSWPDASCIPEGYFFEVSASHTMDDDIRSGPVFPVEGMVYGMPYLEDCRVYHWRVRAVIEGGPGPASQDYFFTDFEGTCPQYACDAGQLAAPLQLSPVNGAVVDAILGDFRFTWDYVDPACIPDGYYVEVYSGADLDSSPLGEGFALDTRGPYGPIPEIPSYVDLPDCTSYTWRVAAMVGTEVGPFSETTFETDYTGYCDDPTAAFPAQLAGVACMDDNRMMVSFRFQEPPAREHEAVINGVAYDCRTLPDSPGSLYCVGPQLAENIRMQVTLTETVSGEVVYDASVSSPTCVQPVEAPRDTCAPPPEGCVAANGGDPCWVWREEFCSCICYN